MLERGKMERGIYEIVDTESLVPVEHLLRKIDAAVDFNKIYDMVEPMYYADNGRPSVDPVVLFKMVLIRPFKVAAFGMCILLILCLGYNCFNISVKSIIFAKLCTAINKISVIISDSKTTIHSVVNIRFSIMNSHAKFRNDIQLTQCDIQIIDKEGLTLFFAICYKISYIHSDGHIIYGSSHIDKLVKAKRKSDWKTNLLEEYFDSTH